MATLNVSLTYRLPAIIICSGSLSTKRNDSTLLLSALNPLYSPSKIIYTLMQVSRRDWIEKSDFSILVCFSIFPRPVCCGTDSPRIARHPEGWRKSNVNRNQAELKIVPRFFPSSTALPVDRRCQCERIGGDFSGDSRIRSTSISIMRDSLTISSFVIA